MCLAIPGLITRITDAEGANRSAQVDYPGLTRSVSLLYLPEARVGDYVLVQAGFAIRLLTEGQAQEVIAALESSDPAAPASTGARGGAA